MEDPQESGNSISGRPGCSANSLTAIQSFNIILGAISFGLWIPGYEDEFHGEIYNPTTGDTVAGYGHGYRSEPLNEFVLAAIIICLLTSIITMLFRMIATRPVFKDGARFNKLLHLILGIFLLIVTICAAIGASYFQENCCHVRMEWNWDGAGFRTANFKGYSRHCYCYLTRYSDNLNPLVRKAHGKRQEADSVLYDPIRNPVEINQYNEDWKWAAHHIHSHAVAVFIIFINSILYVVGFLLLKCKKSSA